MSNNLSLDIFETEIEGSLDPYDYGDNVILKWKGKELRKEYVEALSLEDKTKLVEELFIFYRNNGFPYPKHRDAAMKRDWFKLKESSIRPDENKQISNKSRAGMDLVQNFTSEQFYTVGSDTAVSMLDAFNNNKTLKNVLKNRTSGVAGWEYFHIHGAMIRQGFRSSRSCAVVSNFNCLLAKYFYETFSKKGDWVFDYSMGFGQRMVAALSCERNYVACDPWKANIDSGEKILDFIATIDKSVLLNTTIELNNVGSETYCPDYRKGTFSLAFSSPPYFTKEIYDKSENGQSTHKKSYDEWINDWWRTVVSNINLLLKEDGVFIVNMVSILDGKKNILGDMLNICKEFGFEEVDRYFIQMSQSHFAKFKKTDVSNFIHKSEPIVVLKRSSCVPAQVI